MEFYAYYPLSGPEIFAKCGRMSERKRNRDENKIKLAQLIG